MNHLNSLLYGFVLLLLICSCKETKNEPSITFEKPIIKDTISIVEINNQSIKSSGNVILADYFKWMDSLVQELNLTNSYEVDEYAIVHKNSWILDSLVHTDYYYLKDKGILIDDPKLETIIEKGQIIVIPNENEVTQIKNNLDSTILDLNIPEYKLRIIQNGKVLYQFTVRVGKNKSEYLAMAKHNVDLRTKKGIGKIVRINKNPSFINPKNNRTYKATKRDDNRYTALPNIPWIEPELDGIRYGQLIHPTTNLNTLGKPVSNGCIGLRESDSWITYYYAPLGTRVHFRYDLEVLDKDNKLEILPDIYNKNTYANVQKSDFVKPPSSKSIKKNYISVCTCGSM